jgi:hypothetical protein
MRNVGAECVDNRRKTMSKWIAMGAALTLLGGVTVASAQSPGTPGAGSPGQDQRGAEKAGSVKQSPAQKSEKDAPPSSATTGAGSMGTPKAPSAADKNSIHQSTGDRDSRDYPKQK